MANTSIFNKIFIYSLALIPILGFISVTVLDAGIYNIMILMILIFALVIYFIKIGNGKEILIPKYAWFILIFFFYVLFSDLFIVKKDVSGIYNWYRYFKQSSLLTFFVLIIIENIHFKAKTINNIIMIGLFIIILATGVIIIQQTINARFFVYYNPYSLIEKGLELSSDEMRLPSIYSWSSGIDGNFHFVPYLSLVLAYFLRKKKNMSAYLIFFLGVVFSFICKARSAMINIAFLGGLFLVYKTISIKHFIRSALIITISSLIIINTLEKLDVPVKAIITNRIFEVDKGGLLYGSASTRILAFQVFGKLFSKHSFLGAGSFKYGAGSTAHHQYELEQALAGRSSQIHVGFLSLFYYWGIAGGIWFILFLLFLLKNMYKNAKLTNEWGAFFGFMVFVISNLSLVWFNLYNAGFVLCLIFDKYYIDRYNFQKMIESQYQNNNSVAKSL